MSRQLGHLEHSIVSTEYCVPDYLTTGYPNPNPDYVGHLTLALTLTLILTLTLTLTLTL